MKNSLQILFALMLCMCVCQTNIQGQIFKKAAKKEKESINNVPNVENDFEKKEIVLKAEEAPSTGPAKALAPDIKNTISEIRAYTGLTKEAFEAKVKSLGFIVTRNEIKMGNTTYKSNMKGYLLSADFGTRDKIEFVRSVYKCIVIKNPNLNTVKSSFLGYGVQCTDLNAKYNGGFISVISDKGNLRNFRTAEERTSKFIPAFNKLISGNEEGDAVDAYWGKDYQYSLTYRYAKVMGAILIIKVTDLTIAGHKR